MFRRAVSTTIAASPEAVFQYISDVGRHSEWAADALAIILEAGQAHGPGTRFSSTTPASTGAMHAQGMIVTEEPPTRFAYECRDRSGCYRWTMLVHPEGGGTRLTHQVERLSAPLWIRLLQPWLLWPLGKHGVQQGLANLKARLESDSLAEEEKTYRMQEMIGVFRYE